MRRVFNTNNLFLLVSALCVFFGISMFWQSCGKQTDLVFHKGVLSDKRISVTYERKHDKHSPDRIDSTLIFQFTIAGNPDEFTIRWLPKAMNNLLDRGDTVVFYTKPVVSALGNAVSNGLGHWTTTRSDREVFSLECSKYESPILDFNEYNRNMKTGGCACFVMSILFVFGYFVKRYGNGLGAAR